MSRIILKSIFIFFFLVSYSSAVIIKDVQVSGNKRLSKESIIVFGNIDFNSDYTQEELNDILKNIYSTDFFKEIKFQLNNSVLVIKVIENPIIEDIEINGIKSSKLNELLLEKTKLKSRKSYLESTFLSDLNLIKNIIKSNGYYFSEIKTKSIKNEETNSIRLIYDIDLGKKAKISEIIFIGDKKFKDRKLRSIITSDENKFWKFISQSVYLNYDRIELDKRLITNYYKNNGYYNVDVTNSFIEFNKNGSFKLTFNINAGKKFKFNELDLVLSENYDPKYFKNINKALNKLKGQEYSMDKIEKVLREVDKIALSKQYEFIDAALTEKIIDGDKLNISVSLVDTEKFYVEKINILGNVFTLEEVIRNSFIVDEGDPFNEILFNKSINNIKAKNIFGKVEAKILPGSNKNLKIVDLSVEEKPTGEISLGAGFGTTGGTIGGGIKENNFLGKGIKLNSNIQLSDNSIRGIFVYEKPNFNYSDNTLFTSISSTSTDNLSSFGYKTSDIGLSFGTAFEQYENLYFRPEIKTKLENLETTSKASSSIKKQEGNYFDAYFKYTLDYDKRNKRYRPDEGFRNKFSQDIPLISENYELTNSFETTRYKKVSSLITKTSFLYKRVDTLNDENVRSSKRLNIPSSKLRGFESGKVGPNDNSVFVGGNNVSSLNFNATMPGLLPSFQNTDFSFFIDAANVWGVDYNSTLDGSKIRSATGIAIDILTPVGPLNFSLAHPITHASTDITETFRFNLGTTF